MNRDYKFKKLNYQLTKFDFVGVGKAHVDTEKCAVYNATNSHEPSYNFWLSGEGGGDGGLGILITKKFAEQFTHFGVTEVSAQRCFRLTLVGPQGTLDLYSVYANPYSRAHRVQMYHDIKKVMRPQQERLTILIGDWNFVESDVDRINNTSQLYTGHSNVDEAKEFNRIV